MNTRSAFNSYRQVIAKLNALSYAINTIYYDSATAAPEKSAAARGRAMEYLSGEEYRLRTSKKMKNALNHLLAHLDELTPGECREIEFFNRSAEYTASIPEDEYIEYSVLINDAESVWHKAKRDNDYAFFEPYLAKIIECNLRFAGYYKPNEAPYDVCLGLYERGLNTKKCDAFFSGLRERIVPIIKKISEKPQPDDSFMHKFYPIEAQRKLSDELLRMMSIDRTRCNIGETEHPFTTGNGKNDVRITTHYYENDLASSIYSVIHEGGHALYDMGSADEYENTPLAGGVSMGIHESQSRLYENIFGRNRHFIKALFPVLTSIFPEQLNGIDAEKLYLAVNKSEPSLIRTEADELTYSLHVMVRYELERELISGKLSTKDLPSAWNEKMREYLGVTPPTDREGVLQDSHWSGGAIGYFPSYALGSAYAAQIVAVMEHEINIEAELESGNLANINEWLCEKLHRHGCRYDPDELIYMICKEEFSPKYYIDYLEKKFSDIYKL